MVGTFYDLKKNVNNEAEFSIKDVDVSIVNSIRRTIQAHVQNVAFFFDAKSIDNPDIEIIQNDSPLHNEFLAQRLSMIPIHFEEKIIDDWDREEFSFEIDEENNSNKFMNITSKHIKLLNNNIISRDQLFPPNNVTGDHILITKLPPGTTNESTKIHVKLKASRGSGQQHSCFSPTSLCTYMNKIVGKNELEKAEKNFVDEYVKQYESVFLNELKKEQYNSDKDDHTTRKVNDETKYYKIDKLELDNVKRKAELKFNTIDKQREYIKNEHDEPKEFVFKLESECGLKPAGIFLKAIDYLLSRIKRLMTSEDLEINSIDENQFEIIIPEESHTIGNLIQALVYNEFIRKDKAKKISFIGYFVTHPLESTVHMKLTTSTITKSNDVLKFFKDEALRHVEDSLRDFHEEFKKFTKQF